MEQNCQPEIFVEAEDGEPVFVTLPNTRRFPVVIVDDWIQTDEHWADDPELHCFRVERDEEGSRGQFVIACETETSRWRYIRAFD